jgi:hypothetical protein
MVRRDNDSRTGTIEFGQFMVDGGIEPVRLW